MKDIKVSKAIKDQIRMSIDMIIEDRDLGHTMSQDEVNL